MHINCYYKPLATHIVTTPPTATTPGEHTGSFSCRYTQANFENINRFHPNEAENDLSPSSPPGVDASVQQLVCYRQQQQLPAGGGGSGYRLFADAGQETGLTPDCVVNERSARRQEKAGSTNHSLRITLHSSSEIYAERTCAAEHAPFNYALFHAHLLRVS
ncbi:Hypothetical protein SMAX5B_005311 [Scophthalmus maximus]|uniref:Uncharacterized protein n=1 Tax=Scophthalmus maximus TaxID=52904 RepID=A0A2U9CHM8_SCOMX|nr:Hypothetical protein SMAX5B_005311 [Scophthalmus maximus]